MSKRKQMPLFWKIYFGALAVGFVVLIIVLIWLHGFLADYEAAQPKHLAENIYSEYFKDFDAEQYLELCGAETGVFEKRENVVQYLTDITKDADISYYAVSTGMDNGYKYVVKADDTRFAAFTLVEDESAGKRFTVYKTEGFMVYMDSGSKITIEAPTGYSVFVNDIAVDDSYITEKDIKTPSCEFMPEGVTGTILCDYTIEGLVVSPTVTVKSPDGKEAQVENSGSKFTASVVYDDSLKSEYNDWIINAAEKYATYMQYDSTVAAMSFGSVSPYFDPSSELYEDIRTVENGFVIEYSSYEFSDEATDEYTRYDDNTFSCRVKLTQILHRNGDEDYKDYLDLTLYLRDTGNGNYLIYNMSSN